MPLTTSQIVAIAKVSQALAQVDVMKGSLFSPRLAPQTPHVLRLERRAVEWRNSFENLTNGTRSVSTITVDTLGSTGDLYVFTYDYAGIGTVNLGNYTTVSGDTTTTILAASIVTALNSNNYGFSFTSLNNIITCTAPLDIASDSNGTAINCDITTASIYLSTIASPSVNAAPSSGDSVMYILKVVNNTLSSKTITNIITYVKGNHSAGDFFSADVYFNSSAVFAGASYLNSAVPIDSNTLPYDIAVSQAIGAGVTRYILLVLSVNATPVAGRTGFINGAVNPVVLTITGTPAQVNNQSNLSGIVTIT